MTHNDQYAHVGEPEHALMKRLHGEGLGVGKIAKQLGRSKDTVYKHVFAKNQKKKSKGRPKSFPRTPSGFKAVEKAYGKLLKKTKGMSDVTVQMVKEDMGLTCSPKSISRALWDNGVHFRPQYEKPDLDDADKKERREWAHTNKHRSAAQWNNYVHTIIDNKVFQVFTKGKHRDIAARRTVRGA